MRNLIDINLVIVVSNEIDIEVQTFLNREEAREKFLEAAKDAGWDYKDGGYNIVDDGYYTEGGTTVFLYSTDVNAADIEKLLSNLKEGM